MHTEDVTFFGGGTRLGRYLRADGRGAGRVRGSVVLGLTGLGDARLYRRHHEALATARFEVLMSRGPRGCQRWRSPQTQVVTS